MLEKTLESPLDCKEIQQVHSKGDQPWDFFGRNDAQAETPVLWPPQVKSWLIGKDSDAGRDWGQEEKGMTEDEMAGWHHWLDGRESEWTPGVGDGQGDLAYCDSWDHKESVTTDRLIWCDLIWSSSSLFHSSSSAVLLLFSFKVFLGSVTLSLISVCLFFISFMYLVIVLIGLIFFWDFLLFSRLCDVAYYNYFEFFFS